MQETQPDLRRVLNRTGLAFALFFVLYQTVPSVLSALLSAAAPGAANSQIVQALLSTLPGYIVGLPAVWLVLRTARTPCPEQKKSDLTAAEFAGLAVVCIGAVFVFNLVGNGINLLVSLIKGSAAANLINTVLVFDTPVLALMTVVIAPFAEEFLYRKVLWRWVGALGVRVYVFTSAALFMLAHGNVVQYPYTFVLGLIFAAVYAKTGRLLYPVALHMTVNFIGGVMASLAQTNAVLAGVLGWIYLVCTAAAVGLCVRHRDFFEMPDAPEHALHDAMHCPGMLLCTAVSLAMAAFIIIFL